MPASSEFRLDVEAAEEAVRALEEVRRQIKRARDQAVKLAKVPPTAHDMVSLEAFALLAEKADGGPGSFTASMDAGFAYVENLLQQMRADITRQREIDDQAAGFTDRVYGRRLVSAAHAAGGRMLAGDDGSPAWGRARQGRCAPDSGATEPRVPGEYSVRHLVVPDTGSTAGLQPTGRRECGCAGRTHVHVARGRQRS